VGQFSTDGVGQFYSDANTSVRTVELRRRSGRWKMLVSNALACCLWETPEWLCAATTAWSSHLGCTGGSSHHTVVTPTGRGVNGDTPGTLQSEPSGLEQSGWSGSAEPSLQRVLPRVGQHGLRFKQIGSNYYSSRQRRRATNARMLNDLGRFRFTTSIVSYPNRGPWGDSAYRGNCTGHIIRAFLATYHVSRHDLFVDPMEGSGTARDVAADLSIPYVGLDLRSGFDATQRDLMSELGSPAGTIWIHPPYAGMIPYSGHQWGTAVHSSDLSSARADLPAFSKMLGAVLKNAYKALRPLGHYGVLIGSWRKDRRYYDLPQVVTSVAPGELVDVIIKIQHNTRSLSTPYGGRLVRIAHEHLFVFRRLA